MTSLTVTLPRKCRHLKDRWGLVSLSARHHSSFICVGGRGCAKSHAISAGHESPAEANYQGCHSTKHLIASPEQEDNTWVYLICFIFPLVKRLYHHLLCSCVPPLVLYNWGIHVGQRCFWSMCATAGVCVCVFVSGRFTPLSWLILGQAWIGKV